MLPPSENGHTRPAKADRKSSTSNLLNAFRNLTSRSFSSTSSPPLNPVSTPASLTATISERETLWSSQMGTSTTDNEASLIDSSRQSISTSMDGVLLVGASAELNTLFIKLRPGKSLSGRIQAALDIATLLSKQKVRETIPIWAAGSDLINESSAEAIDAGLKLLIACIEASQLTSLERTLLWESLIGFNHPNFSDLRLGALKALTDNGRNIECLQVDLATFLSRLLQEAYRSAAKSRKKDKTAKGDPTSRREQNLNNVFHFTTDVVRFNSIILSDEDLATLITQQISISKDTISKTDLINATNVISAIATFTNVSPVTFRPCIEILCQIYRQIDSLKDHVWTLFKRIFQSNLRNDSINILFESFQLTQRETNAITAPDLLTLQGAFLILRKLTLDNGMDNLPQISLAIFTTAVDKALQRVSDRSFRLDVLKFYDTILDEPSLQRRLLDDVDWVHFSSSLERCYVGLDGNFTKYMSPLKVNGNSSNSLSDKINDHNRTTKSSERELAQSVTLFTAIIDKLCLTFDELNIIHQDQAIRLFFRLGDDLNNNGARILLSHLASRPLMMPPSFGTRQQVWRHIAIHIAQNMTRPASIRLSGYEYLTERYGVAQHLPEDEVKDFVTLLLLNMDLEDDAAILDLLATFAIRLISGELRDALFDMVNGRLRASVFNRRVKDASTASRRPSVATIPATKSSQASQSRIIVRHVIRLFLTTMNQSGYYADLLYHFILDVAGTESLEADARICALKLLFRIRCTADYRIFVAFSSESESIAAVVCRTFETAVVALNDLDATRENRNASTGQIPSSGLNKSRSINVMRPVPPLWFYPGPKALPHDPSKEPSLVLHAQSPEKRDDIDPWTTLPVYLWLEAVIHILQQPKPDWEIYSYVLVHLAAQLKNKTLFDGAIRQIRLLRNIICDQIRSSSFQSPPNYTSLKKADVAVCLFHVLTMLIGYNEHFAKSEVDDIVKIFISGIGNWDGTSKWCIHALSLCCHEIPLSVSKSLEEALRAMSRIITQPKIAIHILEFLCSLSRLPEVYKNFTEDEYKLVFAVSFRYLQWVRDQKRRAEESNSSSPPHAKGNKRYSDSIREVRSSPDNDSVSKPKLDDELPQYVYALAYHVITFWFMALKLQDRPGYMQWIAKNLVYQDASGKDIIEDQGMVTLDMMDRIAYSDRDETAYIDDFAKPADGELLKETWIVGMGLLTIETAGRTGLSQLTRRRPSGTRYTIYRPSLYSPPRHQVPMTTGIAADVFYTSAYIGVLPQDIIQELYSSIGLAVQPIRPGSHPEVPVLLPKDDMVRRAIATFDRNSTVDGHKIGVIYIGEGQTKEVEILANTLGSPAYAEFVSQLGTLVRLKDSKMNCQGLDRSDDSDGRHAICWRDRSTEVVFHVTTMMPTDMNLDPRCDKKKSHIGNDFVNIVWNDSGSDFSFSTFPSDFNYVYIVISPEVRTEFITQRKILDHSSPNDQTSSIPSIEPPLTHTPSLPEPSPTLTLYYKVQVLSAPNFPSISPAAETKLVSAKALPSYIRLLALNASFFSLVWANRAGGEHISPWRNRLREIQRLREKYSVPMGPAGGSIDGISNSAPPSAGLSGPGGSARSSNAGGLLAPPQGSGSMRAGQRVSGTFGGGLGD